VSGVRSAAWFLGVLNGLVRAESRAMLTTAAVGPADHVEGCGALVLSGTVSLRGMVLAWVSAAGGRNVH